MSAGRSTDGRASRVERLLGEVLRSDPGTGERDAPLFGSIHGNGSVTITVNIGGSLVPKPDTDRNRRLTGIRARIARTPRGAAKLDAYLLREFNGLALDDLSDDDVAKVYSWTFSLLVQP